MLTHKPFAGALSAIVLALAGNADAEERLLQSAEYDACIALAERAPVDALASARSWEELGGGNPARHCAAIALFNLRQYRDAAASLDALAAEIGGIDPALTAGLYDQAGRAWLLAEAPNKSLTSFGRAIALSPTDADLYIARSYAYAARQDYAGALDDLRQAETLAPERAEVFLLKAAALRFQGDAEAALAEAERAVSAAPSDPEVFLERGNIRWLLADRSGARQDWQQAESLAPDSVAAEAARRNLSRLQ